MRRWLWAIGLVVIVVLGGLVVIAPLMARTRVPMTPLLKLCVEGRQVAQAQVIGLREMSRLPELDELIWSNYFSPQLLSELIAPGAATSIHWEWKDTNERPKLLDAKGNIVSLAKSDEPMRLGSLVVYPRDEALIASPNDKVIAPPDWSMVVIPSARVKEFVVVLTDTSSRVVRPEEFSVE